MKNATNITVELDYTTNVAKIVTGHTHAPQAGRPVAIRLSSEIKERDQNNRENPQQLIATVLKRYMTLCQHCSQKKIHSEK
jgi:hypothetical protein